MPPIRAVTGAEQAYVDEPKLCDKAIEITALIPLRQYGIQADGRGFLAMKTLKVCRVYVFDHMARGI
ncbi:hypothetical protein GCM10027066_04490 [Dyella jejuensis]